MSAVVTENRPALSSRSPSSGPRTAGSDKEPVLNADAASRARAARLEDARRPNPRSGGSQPGEPQTRESDRPSPGRASGASFSRKSGGRGSEEKTDHPILFQQFFKSVGPRTYAVQVKKATNGNHYIVFTEGRRDDKTGDVRKTRINIFSEDFDAFFDLLRQAAQHVKANPLPPDFVAKRKKLWATLAKKKSKGVPSARERVDFASPGSAGGTSARVGDRRETRPSDRIRADAGGDSSGATPGRGPDRGDDSRPRNEPPAAPARPAPPRPLPTARAAAGA